MRHASLEMARIIQRFRNSAKGKKEREISTDVNNGRQYSRFPAVLVLSTLFFAPFQKGPTTSTNVPHH